MMMMGGNIDFESILPMLLMTSMSTTVAPDGTSATNPMFGQGNNFMQMMMQMQMMKMMTGSNDTGGGLFGKNNTVNPRFKV